MPIRNDPVRINDADGDERLFMVHAVDGTSGAYKEFARAMSPDVQVLFFDGLGMRGERDPIMYVEDMARIYNRGLVETRSSEPYRICGHSAGGLIAYEMARQLISAGRTVELRLFDTGVDSQNLRPHLKPGIWLERAMWKHFVNITFRQVEWLLQFDSNDDRIFSSENVFWELNDSERLTYLVAMLPAHSKSEMWAKSSRSHYEAYFRFFRALWLALYQYYRPQPCEIKLTYYMAAETHDPRSPHLWVEITKGNCEIVTVPGTHMSMIRGDYGPGFGEMLKQGILSSSYV
jgi:thioesterase domain-containing protein